MLHRLGSRRGSRTIHADVHWKRSQLKTCPAGARGAATPKTVVLLFVVLVIAWLLWSGVYKPLVIGLGVVSCVLTVVLATRTGFFEPAREVLHLFHRLPRYWLWLLKEIVLSSITVAKIVLSPTVTTQPTLVRMKMKPSTDMTQVILGNSITLSPGTITIDIFEDEVLVHCITREGAQELLQGEFNQSVKNLESA